MVTTPSSDNFLLANKNIYQRQRSQESNSKISSASGKDKKYTSKRLSQIKNILSESKSSLLLNIGEINNLQPFNSNDIIIETEPKNKNDLIKKHIDKIEDIDDKKRKSNIFKFKYLDKMKSKGKSNIINTEIKEKNKYEFNNEENIINEDKENKEELVKGHNLPRNKIIEIGHEKISKEIKKEMKKNIYVNKNLLKKKLKIKTEEEENSEDNEAEEKNLNNIKSESNIQKKKYIQTEKIFYDKSSHKRNLPLQIKVFKCIIYINKDPFLDEKMILDALHKRNKSQKIDKNNIIIKKPKKINSSDKKRDDDIEEIKDKKEKKKKFRMSFLKGSKSSAII